MAKDQVIISQGGLLLQVFGTQRVRPPFYARGVFPGVYTSRELFNLSCPRPGVGLAREKWGGLPRPEPHRIWRPAIPGFVPVDCFFVGRIRRHQRRGLAVHSHRRGLCLHLGAPAHHHQEPLGSLGFQTGSYDGPTNCRLGPELQKSVTDNASDFLPPTFRRSLRQLGAEHVSSARDAPNHACGASPSDYPRGLLEACPSPLHLVPAAPVHRSASKPRAVPLRGGH